MIIQPKRKAQLLTICIILILLGGALFLTSRKTDTQNTIPTDSSLTPTSPPQISSGGICGKVLTGQYVNGEIAFPLNCSENIAKLGGKIDFIFTKDDKIEIKRNGVLIYSTSGTEEQSYVASLLGQSAFKLLDVNYDGYPDISLLTAAGAYNFTYSYFVYNPTTKSFDQNPFIELANPEINTVNQTAVSYFKGRGLGDYFNSETYHFENGKYILIKEELRQITSDIDAPKLEYLHTIKELQNGKMVETVREKQTEDEVFQ